MRMHSYEFETWEIPLSPPLPKEDFKSSQKLVWEKKSIRCKLIPVPFSIFFTFQVPKESFSFFEELVLPNVNLT